MENSESGLEKLTESLETLATGIPAPLRKNFFKAFGQLCTASVEIPVTWLEGKASEIKALSEARVQIIKKEGNDISERLEIPKEYVAKASEKYASKIIREQLNLDTIVLNAGKELTSTKIKEDSESNTEIDDDWLNEFENHARTKSSDDMKLIFGKILSGEIQNPGTFSLRTIRLISQLDSKVATLFQLLCAQTISRNFGSRIQDARVISFKGNAGANSLSAFGLSFSNLNVLEEYGLIISDYNSYMHYGSCIAEDIKQTAPTLTFGKKEYLLIPTDKDKYDRTLKLHGVALTQSAIELLNIIPFKEATNYRNALENFLKEKHLEFFEIDKSNI